MATVVSLVLLVALIGIFGGSSTGSSGSANSLPSPLPEASLKAQAKSISYAQLVKDPNSLKGTLVTYTAQISQYDSVTTTSNFLADVTDQSGFWTDSVWFDVDPASAKHACQNTVVRVWGPVAGSYNYTTQLNAQNTVPEIRVDHLEVVSGGC